jgi:pilus assembly protein CpaE
MSSPLPVIPDSLGVNPLSIAVISPNTHHRNAAISALERFPNSRIREYITYPPGAEDVAQVLRQDFDVVIIDLDSDPGYALELVENICIDGSTNVIVYSALPDPDLLLRCMRSGAREFLAMPLTSGAMAEALIRVSARRLDVTPQQKTIKRPAAPSVRGKMLVFMSAKGGAGVTTLACGLATALAQDFGQHALLIDLTLPLGDAALNLGLRSQYSTINALENATRLDGSFLETLLVKHESGLNVLAAPSELAPVKFPNDAIFKLLRVARQNFEFVIVDAGSRLNVQEAFPFDENATLYLVTQIGIPELRNSNRLIKELKIEGGPSLEIILNRYNAGAEGIEEEQVTKALTRQAQWKIPNDYSAVRRMQNLATPLNQEDTEIARSIRKMAESICGVPATPKKKKGLRFF